MSDSGKAVFLSYASQDAEAAQRICEALLAAGIEVWFDQSELVGGDAWDQKIRKQIRECALLLPVISKTTQGRREAYFRLEWKLADERTHLMARGTPFLLPITIDETSDRDALVPDSFLAIQWTKAPGGDVPPAFVARVKRLLGGDTLEGGGALRPAPSEKSGHKAIPAATNPRWLKPVLASAAVLIGVLAYTLVRRPPADGANSPSAASAQPPASASAPAVSAARELVEKAYPLIHALDARREDFALAEDYCQRALKLDPDDGEIWAAYAQVHSAFGYRGWDTSPERREQTRVAAERAIRLAPRSVRARLAQAGAWSTFGINRDGREKLLRDIVNEQPDHQEALRFLAVTVLAKPNGLEEALALNERSAALPGGDPLALFNNARYLLQRGRQAEAYATLQRSLAQKKFTSALVLKVAMEINWRGDLAAAEETLQQVPGDALLEDRANYVAGLLRYYQRNGAAALATWQTFPRDFYNDFVFDGPKGLLLGLADELDHREAAARTEWRAALTEVEKKIAAAPNRAAPYYSQAFLLACLGEKTAASEALRTHEQLAGIKYSADEPMPVILAQVYARLGRFDEIFAFPPANRTILKVSPIFDPLRADPRFQALVEKSSFTQAPETGSGTTPPDTKSVAVLAFANLSDEKANEYFSDGISEELLNVLVKIPGLKVAARTSAFYFKGKDVPIPEIGQKLGVAYVVEGSVRKAGDKVRITAQLIKTADGFHVWSETFTRDLKDIFAVQDEIAGLIAKKLEVDLGASQSARGEINPEAFQLLLAGRAKVRLAGNANRDAGIADFRAAVALAPDYAEAWAEMAHTYIQNARFGGVALETGFREARLAAQRALALAPDSAKVLAAVGWVRRTADWDWRGAEQACRRALELSPDDADILTEASVILVNVGHGEEGIELGRRAVKLDPLNPEAHFNLSFILGNAGRSEEAVEAARRAVDLAPGAEDYRSNLAAALSDVGRLDEADRELALEPHADVRITCEAQILVRRGKKEEARARILELEGRPNRHHDMAEIYALNGDIDLAFAALEKSYALHETGIAWCKVDFYLNNLHRDPRWPVFLRKVGLADDQLK